MGGAYVWICYLESGWTARWALSGQSLRRLGRSWRRPGRSWGGLGGLLEPWRPFGRSWGGLGDLLGALGAVLEASSALLGALGRVLGFGTLSGVSWGVLRGILGAQSCQKPAKGSPRRSTIEPQKRLALKTQILQKERSRTIFTPFLGPRRPRAIPNFLFGSRGFQERSKRLSRGFLRASASKMRFGTNFGPVWGPILETLDLKK